MNLRGLTKLILLFKEFRQIFHKTAGNCENFGIVNNFGHNSGQCPELVDKRVWYGTVIIQGTFYSSKSSQFETISKLQLCSHNSGQCLELSQRSAYLVILDSAPNYEEKYSTTLQMNC